MPRKSRVSQHANYYHAMIHATDKEYPFNTDLAKNLYLKYAKLYKIETNIKIIGYCIMDNHVHFLLHAKNVLDMGAFFKGVNQSFAQKHNFFNQRRGHVFLDRYKSKPILDERQLLYCLAYIHNNPLEADMLENAKEYKYSSYQDFLRGESDIIDFDECRKHFDPNPDNILAIMEELTKIKLPTANPTILPYEYAFKLKIVTEIATLLSGAPLDTNKPLSNKTKSMLVNVLYLDHGFLISDIVLYTNISKNSVKKYLIEHLGHY